MHKMAKLPFTHSFRHMPVIEDLLCSRPRGGRDKSCPILLSGTHGLVGETDRKTDPDKTVWQVLGQR